MNIDAQISASNALMLEKMMTTPKEAFVPRPDGRAVDALRPVEITRRFTKYAEGSVLMCAGDTHVLCTASVTVGVPNFLRGKGEGWVTAEYGLLPRSTGTRTDREAARGKQTGRTQEIQRLIGRSLRAVVDRKKLGEHTIQIDCDVLQADGGTRCASITGAWIALRDAVDWMLAKGMISEDPILAQVSAVSVGMWSGEPVLDLNYAEDSASDTDMNVVMTSAGKYVEIQGTAEGDPFSEGDLGVKPCPEPFHTFIENCLAKARHAAKETGRPAMADDSGLCVDALGGAPGVYSARFAGEDATDEDNNRLLMEKLHGVKNRQGHYVCVLVAVRSPDDPEPLIAEGTWEGVIAEAPKGSGGFGYDPLFCSPAGCFGQLTPKQKDAVSHRGKALCLMAAELKKYL